MIGNSIRETKEENTQIFFRSCTCLVMLRKYFGAGNHHFVLFEKVFIELSKMFLGTPCQSIFFALQVTEAVISRVFPILKHPNKQQTKPTILKVCIVSESDGHGFIHLYMITIDVVSASKSMRILTSIPIHRKFEIRKTCMC